MSMKEELLFDLIESEAELNIFLDRDGFTAKGAGIIVTGSPLGHFPKRKGDKFTLWFGRGVLRETFKTKKEAYKRVIKMLGTSRLTLKVGIEGSDAKTFKKMLDIEVSGL